MSADKCQGVCVAVSVGWLETVTIAKSVAERLWQHIAMAAVI